MKLKNNNFAEKIVNFLLNILLIIFGFILLISIYTGVQMRILGNDYANFFGYSIFEVQTGSMADTINPGDCIIVKLTNKVKLNDVVTYKSGKEYVTHRIVEVYNGTYVTKGDANNAKDEPINQKQIVGKVVNIWVNFGAFRKTLFNPSVLIALIITLFLFDLAFKKNKKEDHSNTKNSKLVRVLVNKTNVIIKKINPLFESAKEYINKIRSTKNNVDRKGSQNTPNHTYNNFKGLIRQVGNNEYRNNEFDEDELDKTSFYRIVTVDSDELNGKSAGLVNQIEKEEFTKDAYKDNDLEKTSLYRVVSVDANEVDNKFKEPIKPTTKPVENTNEDDFTKGAYKDDELDKTSFYRVISVDADEVNDTLLEIADNEIKETGKDDKNKEQVAEVEPQTEEVKEDNTLTNIDLSLLKNKEGSLKGKNVIDTVINIKEEELKELINILLGNDKHISHEANIRDMFINTYLDTKYNNHYSDDSEHEGKISVLKIEKAIKQTAGDIISDYHNNSKYNDLVNKHMTIMMLIANLDQAKDSIADLRVKSEFYKKTIIKYFKDLNSQRIEYLTNEILKIQRNYMGILDYYFKKLETNMFSLNFNKLSTKKNMYGLELEHNITFSKVYSDYIIDRTYTEGIIAEDKMTVLLTLLSVQLIKDMMLSNFNRKYILHIPESLYSKEKKFDKLLKMIEEDYAKERVVILLTFEELVNNKQILKEVRKMGYKFALVFDKDYVVEAKERGYMYIADYIFIDRKVVNTTKLLPFIPEELMDKIIYEDIYDKVGDLGDE